ncbi:MAG: response regulator transcription factor [Planctomycetaceae bacterium]
MARPTVLVIEDDRAIRRGLVDALGCGGYKAIEAADGPDGLRAALGVEPDLVLLDVLLPGRDGFSVLEELRRAKPALPIIMITARGAESDRVRGLKGGADDYVVKPFSAMELLARVEAVLRRSAERPHSVGDLDVEGRVVRFERREVAHADGALEQLSEREGELLRYLAACRGRAVSREEILQRVWGLDPRGVETRTIDMHIARLREKLRDDPRTPRIIVTVRGKGYMLAGGAGA